MTSRVLSIIICAAGPACDAGKLVSMASDQGWRVQVIATPPAIAFLDIAAIEAQTGQPVRSQYSQYSPSGSPRSPVPDAIIVAPATYNTINKWANGISDTYALGILAEAPGLGVPVVVLPFVNTSLAGREAFRDSVARLRREGITILLGDGGFEPHPPRTGGAQAASFPWCLALAEVQRVISSS